MKKLDAKLCSFTPRSKIPEKKNRSEISQRSEISLDTGMQREDEVYVASRKLSVRMPILLPMQKKYIYV